MYWHDYGENLVMPRKIIDKAKGRLNKIWISIGLMSVEAIVVTIIFFIAVIAFVKITDEVFIDKKQDIDEVFFAFLKDHVNFFNTRWMEFFTFFGKHIFLLPANLLLLLYYVFKRNKWYSIKIPAIALSSTALLFLLKSYFNRQRPLFPLLDSAKGLSFPSGHALSSVAFFGLLIYIVHKNVKNRLVKLLLIILLVFWIVMIGISRVYLRVHYVTDVLAGFYIGFIWLFCSIAVLNRIEKYSKEKLGNTKYKRS